MLSWWSRDDDLLYATEIAVVVRGRANNRTYASSSSLACRNGNIQKMMEAHQRNACRSRNGTIVAVPSLLFSSSSPLKRCLPACAR